MPALRTGFVVVMLALGLLVGPASADIRLPLPGPTEPAARRSHNARRAEPADARTAKADPSSSGNADHIPTGLVVAGGFLSLAIAGFGVVILRSRLRSAKDVQHDKPRQKVFHEHRQIIPWF